MIKINKILATIILLLSIKVQSQEGVLVPLDTWETVPSGTYKKDIDDVFLPYVGTWKGVLYGKEYTFVFQMFPQHMYTNADGTYYYEDILGAKYEVKDMATGNILFTTMSMNNYDESRILNIGSPNNGRQNFLFRDLTNCANSMTFALFNIPGNTNQRRYGGFTYTDFYIAEGCPYADRYDIPVPIPKNGLIFTKQ
jgi:hypothetical protein